MSEKKSDSKQELTNDVLMADVMLRVTAIEKLLIEKGVFTQEELNKTTEDIAQRVAKVVLEKAQASKSVEEFVAKLEETANKGKKDFDN